ncbi:hypothetical protein EDB19DRAFT_1833118 [Suillus lakei]|nr:hypothetical protein EDB19DRAFT_1833118 [Suillus lakei]
MAKISNDMSPIKAGQVFCTLNAAIVVLHPNVAGFYVVVIGYQCGIYLSWCKCEVNVTGYRSPLFKKVTTFTEAMEWFITKGGRAVRQNNTAVTRELAQQPSSSQPLVHLDTIGDIEQHQNTCNQHQLPGSYQIIRNQLPGGYQIIHKHNLAISLLSIATSMRFLAFSMLSLTHYPWTLPPFHHLDSLWTIISKHMATPCMPSTEAMFPWNLISMGADYNDGPLEM